MLSDATRMLAELVSDYVEFESGEPTTLWAGLLERAASVSSGKPDILLLEQRLAVLVDFSIGCGFSKHTGSCERRKRRLYMSMTVGFEDALEYFFVEKAINEEPAGVLYAMSQIDDVLMAAHRVMLRQGNISLSDALAQIGEKDMSLTAGLRVGLVADCMLRAYAIFLATS